MSDAVLFPVPLDWKQPLSRLKFERDMVLSAFVLLLSCPVLLAMHTNFAGEWPILLALFALFACAMPLIVVFRESGKDYWANLISIVYFSFFFAVGFRFLVYLAVRAGAVFALRDPGLTEIDQSLGLAIPNIMKWGSAHWIGRAANWSYFQIEHFMRWTLLLPVLFKRPRGDRKSVV